MKKEVFQKDYRDSFQVYQKYEHTSGWLSFFRFLFFIGFIVCLLIGYFQKHFSFYVIALMCFIIFIIIVFKHNHLKKQLLYFKNKCQVLKNHLLKIDDQWEGFDDGLEFQINDSAKDLDILGSHSLYQMLNICLTYQGQRKLAVSLQKPELNKKDILDRQTALLELKEHEDFILNIQTLGYSLYKNDKNIKDDFQQSLNKQIKSVPKLLFILPLCMIIFLLGVIFSVGLPYLMILCEILFVVQFFITIIKNQQHQQLFNPVKNYSKVFSRYMAIFKAFEKEEFHSSYLKQLQRKCFDTISVVEAIQKLSYLTQFISYRQNIIVYLLGNSLFLYDFWLRNAYLRWLKEYGIYMEKWLDSLSDLEVLMSFYTPYMDGYHVSMPVIKDELSLSFHNLMHPLISMKKNVGNDFKLVDHVNLITGSNMSGKTTFMRTIALNLILSYNGSFIFGDDMECSLMKILTSIRIQDNTQEGISMFYAELLRIKKMIDYSQENLPMICFIDEIFSGTNSLDRIVGAQATIEQLSLKHCLVFMTTHDFELCKNKHVANYYFKEDYQDNQILFSYKMYTGVSPTTNGQFLLKQLGIIKKDEIE